MDPKREAITKKAIKKGVWKTFTLQDEKKVVQCIWIEKKNEFLQ